MYTPFILSLFSPDLRLCPIVLGRANDLRFSRTRSEGSEATRAERVGWNRLFGSLRCKCYSLPYADKLFQVMLDWASL